MSYLFRNFRRRISSLDRHDKPLLVTLFILNIGSGCTTVLGATQILPGVLGYAIGGTVQLILFLLLSGLTAKHAPLRKWLSVMVFSFFSVYTSFFTYYNKLTEGVQNIRSYDQATAAHQKLVSDIYTPLKTQVESLNSEAKQYRDLVIRERNGEITGYQGHGFKAREFAEKAKELELKAAKLEPIVEELKNKFEYELKGLKPNDIFTKDSQALAAVPLEWRKNYPELNRAMYIDEESEVLLLAPYYKIKSGEQFAIVSLFIALTVDGVILLLGTAIVIKHNSPIEDIAHSLIRFITKIKGAYLGVFNALNAQTIPINSISNSDRTELEKGVQVVIFRLRGRGSNFLGEFYTAIDPQTYYIAYDRLEENANTSFTIGFRILLDCLRRPTIGWVKFEEGNWKVIPKYYPQLTEWLTHEIHRQCDEESRNFEEDEFTSERNVPLRIPVGLMSN
ncbi:MAG: hypothetical protein F6K21_09510 [Symploca sp. SIO2D2]|nr:hypothetical protein [Symploca sp. SIO2D2]